MVVSSTLVACCFLRGGAMIDDPNLVEVMSAHENLVEFRVVIHGVHMNPVTAEVFTEVDVDEFRCLTDVAEVVFAGVEILDEMIPEVPFPDNLTARWSCLMDLDEAIRAEIIAKGVRVTSRLDSMGA